MGPNKGFPWVHRFITQTDGSFQALGGPVGLPDNGEKKALPYGGSPSKNRRSDRRVLVFGRKIRVKCSEQFRTKWIRLDSRKRHDAKTAETQR
jgi:hypothetical protein